MEELTKIIASQSRDIKRLARSIVRMEKDNRIIYNKDKMTFLQAFNALCSEKGLFPYLLDVVGHSPKWSDITKPMMERFVKYLSETDTKRTGKPLEPSTQNLYISHLRRIVKWGNTPVNDVTGILKANKITGKKKVWLHPEEIETVYRYQPTDKEKSTWALFLICCLTGCRIIDAPSINESNIDGCTLRYVPIKTLSTECYINIRPEQISVLKRLILIHDGRWNNNILKGIIRNSGITRKFDVGQAGRTRIVNVSDEVHFHTARHSFATIKYRYSGWSEREIAQAVGHTSFSQTWNNYICDKSPITEEDKLKKGLFI